MKKFLLAFICLFCVLALGCGGGPSKPGIKNEAKDFDASKPSIRDEAINFDATYYERGARKIEHENGKYRLAIWDEYYETQDNAKYKEEIKKIRQTEYLKWVDFKERLSKIKLRNNEVGALKIRLETLVESYMKATEPYRFPSDSEEMDKRKKEEANRLIRRNNFDYEKAYAALVDGKPLEIIFPPKALACGVRRISDLLVGIDNTFPSEKLKGEGYHVIPKGKFLVVFVNLYNDGKDAITVESDNFKLIDKDGRKYSTSSSAMAAFAKVGAKAGTNVFHEELNPLMYVRIALAFDMPKDAKEYDYKLQVTMEPKGDKIEIPLRHIAAY